MLQTPSQTTAPVPRPDVRLPELMLCVAIGALMFVAGAWWALGRIVAEKIATSLVMPTGLVWLLLLVAVFAARRAGRRDLMLATAIPWSALTLIGNSLLSERLAQSLEEPYRHIQPLEAGSFDTIVLLGGGTATGGNRRVQGNAAGDRILLTAQMFHAGLTRKIICTGHRIVELDSEGSDPSTQAQSMLTALGIPAESIELLEGRNTAEELRLLGELLGNSNQRIGLITSAWHLTRALRLADRNNLRLDPLPADFITGPRTRLSTAAIVLSCIPQDGAMWTASKVLKEYLGMFLGR